MIDILGQQIAEYQILDILILPNFPAFHYTWWNEAMNVSVLDIKMTSQLLHCQLAVLPGYKEAHVYWERRLDQHPGKVVA